MTPAVHFSRVSRHFGSVRAVDAVDLDVAAGEFFAMLGPSGSGKTTCLRLIAGFEQPTSGHIEILKNGMRVLKHRCVDGIEANKERCRILVESSIGLVTALIPVLGYEQCSALAKEALETGRGLVELVLEKKLLSKKELDKVMAPENMV